jgi:aspartyl-tRNA(Asn)/glutamyl-tRNA(Gln) amidotransferase subunit C
MQINPTLISQIAKLCRLKLSDKEADLYGGQLGSILDYVEKLNELDTDGVEDFQHAAQTQNVFRDDEVEHCEADSRKLAIGNFTNKEGDLLKVQAVFDGNKE